MPFAIFAIDIAYAIMPIANSFIIYVNQPAIIINGQLRPRLVLDIAVNGAPLRVIRAKLPNLICIRSRHSWNAFLHFLP